MAKKKVTYSVFASVTVDVDTDTDEVHKILQRAANAEGWHFAASVSEEPDGDLRNILEETEMDY